MSNRLFFCSFLLFRIFLLYFDFLLIILLYSVLVSLIGCIDFFLFISLDKRWTKVIWLLINFLLLLFIFVFLRLNIYFNLLCSNLFLRLSTISLIFSCILFRIFVTFFIVFCFFLQLFVCDLHLLLITTNCQTLSIVFLPTLSFS